MKIKYNSTEDFIEQMLEMAKSGKTEVKLRACELETTPKAPSKQKAKAKDKPDVIVLPDRTI